MLLVKVGKMVESTNVAILYFVVIILSILVAFSFLWMAIRL